NKEFYRDRATMIWTLLFPFVVLTGFAYGYSGRQDPVLRIAVTPETLSSQAVVQALGATPGVQVSYFADEAAARRKLERYEADLLVLPLERGQTVGYSYNPDSDKGKLAERLLTIAPGASASSPPVHLSLPLDSRRIRYADWLLPGLLAMNIMFGSMFGVGYVIVRYRKNGVLKRLRATPLSAFQFLSAQVASRMLLMIVTSFMVLGGSMILIGFKPAGSWFDLMVFLGVSATSMISLGLLVAARLASEEVADGVLNLMTWPMIFLSGVWFSIEGASRWVLFGAKLMPLTHVVDGLRAILLDGATLASLLPQVTTLLALSLVFLVVGSLIFRWR
ncbi:MAG TPA: ABC transporter permease, partial [Bdellovibrionota bacterium]|nr:ABC transporter permease [Bdellovibrionota bacterium]